MMRLVTAMMLLPPRSFRRLMLSRSLAFFSAAPKTPPLPRGEGVISMRDFVEDSATLEPSPLPLSLGERGVNLKQ